MLRTDATALHVLGTTGRVRIELFDMLFTDAVSCTARRATRIATCMRGRCGRRAVVVRKFGSLIIFFYLWNSCYYASKVPIEEGSNGMTGVLTCIGVACVWVGTEAGPV